MLTKEVVIKQEFIKLDQFIKWAGVTGTGGQSKMLIQSNLVKVNGELENRRGRKIYPGDVVEIVDMGTFKVVD